MQITAKKLFCEVVVKTSYMAIAYLHTPDTVTATPHIPAVPLGLADDMVSVGEINFPWEYTSYLS